MMSASDLTPQPLDQLTKQSRFLVLLGLLGPVVGLGIMGLQDPQDILVFSMSLLIFGLLCIPILFRRTYTLVEPYTIIFAVLYLGIPLKLVWALAYRDSPQLMEFMQGDSVDTLVQPALLSALAVASLSTGYLLGRRLKLRFGILPKREIPWNKNTLLFLSGIGVMISVVAFVMYARQVGINFSGDVPLSAKRLGQSDDGPLGRGSSLAYYRWAISLSQIAFYVVFAWALRRRVNRNGIITLVVLLSVPLFISFLMPFVTSSRTPLIFFLVECLVLLYCLKEDVLTGRWLTTQMVGATIILALFMFILALRSNARSGETTTESLSPVALVEHVVGARYLADITKTAQIYQHFPDRMPYQYGLSYTAAFVAPIPRNSWPTKPAIGLGPFIGENVYGLDRTGVPPGMIGEAYLNFGFFGVALIPLIYGFIARTSFETLRDRLRTRYAALCYAVCFRFYVTVLGVDVSTGLVQFTMELIPVVAIVWLVQLRKRRTAGYAISSD